MKMRFFGVASLVLLIHTLAIAASHDKSDRLIIKGSGAYYHFDNPNEFSFKYDLVFEFWTLLQQPVFYCSAKWQYLPGNVRVDNRGYDKTGVKYVTVRANELNIKKYPPTIYNLAVLVPLNVLGFKYSDIYILCDPGGMSKSGGPYSFNTPGSPNWNKSFLMGNENRTNRGKFLFPINSNSLGAALPVKKKFIGDSSQYNWLRNDAARELAKSILKTIKSNKKNHVYRIGSFKDKIKYPVKIQTVSFGLSGFHQYLSNKKLKEKKSFRKNKNKRDDFWDGEDSKANDRDDFWDGAGDKASSKRSDDFWSGSEQQNDKSATNKNDFWGGEGTKEEEIELEKTVVKATGNQFIGEKTVRSSNVTISYFDHGQIDGDRVNIYLNNKLVASNVTLTSYSKKTRISLKEGVNRVSFEALNNGNVGINTASFTITDDKGKTLYNNEWNISKGYKGTLLLIKI